MTRRKKTPAPEPEVGEYMGVRVQYPPAVSAPTVARLCLELRDLLGRENLDRAGKFMFMVGGG